MPSSKTKKPTHELSILLKLTLPILITQLAQQGMALVDTIMAGRFSAQDLAGIATGAGIWVPLWLLVMGICMATTPSVAQLNGANKRGEIAPLVQQMLWISIPLGILSGLILYFLNQPIMNLLGVSPEIAAPAGQYMQAVAFGVPITIAAQPLRFLSEGMGVIRPIMQASLLAFLINIPLDYLFVFGFADIEGMGGPGCGWATSILMTFSAALWLRNIYRHHNLAPLNFSLKLPAPDWPQIKHQFQVGFPIGSSIFFEISIFSLVTLLLGRLGAITVAANQIAFSATGTLFMIPLSLSMALTIRIGHLLGQGKQQVAYKLGWQGIMTTACWMMASILLIVVFSENIAQFYSEDIQVIALASSLLLYAAMFQLSDGIQVASAGVLRGYKDTAFTMKATMLAYWVIGLPLGYWLAFKQGYLAVGFWYGLIAGLTVAACLLLYRVKKVSSQYLLKAENQSV
ncbi:MATE family efflux transporter [Pelagibaculum spongiae]|uniref:Multidrug-efflux transporter n=1 Tax=Pelagibaculum spongiae TaxID=2080658 RepID=A0A2V1GTS3_9GAMM|nr:MATE family efflux transporter [Pelagibaculum spongiae]PVZ69476.1 MATE family efflux transporter [Pelagibaculum spongiae]